MAKRKEAQQSEATKATQVQRSRAEIETLVNDHFAWAKRYAERTAVGLHLADVEDAIGQGLLALTQAAESWHGKVRFKNFASTCIRNKILNCLRSEIRTKAVQIECLDHIETKLCHDAGECPMRSTLMDVRAATAAILVLRFCMGLKEQEIAVELGVPEGTIKSRIHEAMKEIRTGENFAGTF